jgi:hypothetical protein
LEPKGNKKTTLLLVIYAACDCFYLSVKYSDIHICCHNWMIMRAAEEAKRIRRKAMNDASMAARIIKAALALKQKQKVQKEQKDAEKKKDGGVEGRTVEKRKQNVQIDQKDAEKKKATFALKGRQNVKKGKNDAEEGKDSEDGEIKEESSVDAKLSSGDKIEVTKKGVQETKQSVTASCTVPLNLPTSSTAVSTIATASVVAAPGTCHSPYSFDEANHFF